MVSYIQSNHSSNQLQSTCLSCYSGKCQTIVKTSLVVLGLLFVGAGIATILVGHQVLPQFFMSAADRAIIASVLISTGSLLAITVLASCIINRHLRSISQSGASTPVGSDSEAGSPEMISPVHHSPVRQPSRPIDSRPVDSRPVESRPSLYPESGYVPPPPPRPEPRPWQRPVDSRSSLYPESGFVPPPPPRPESWWQRPVEPNILQPGPSQPRPIEPVQFVTIRDENGNESVIVPSQLVDRCNPDHTFSVIHDYLERAIREIMGRYINASMDFSERIWLLGIYHMIKEGPIDIGACHPVLKIKQHITVSDANRECDDFSTWTEKCKPVTLKNFLEGLDNFQRRRLERQILEANISPEAIPAEFRPIFTELQDMVRILQRRYPFFIDHENRQIHFLPTHIGQCPSDRAFDHHDVKDFAKLVYLRLKNILRESNLTESGHVTDDDLVDYKFIPKVCRLLAFDLISNAKIDQFGRLWFTPFICLSFLPENNDQPFIINELTSHSPTQEDNPVCAQPFELAMKLRDKSPAERQAIRDGIKNANDEEAPVPTELRGEFTALESLLQNRYYKPFVADLSATIEQERENQAVPRVPVATVVPEGVTEVNNDLNGRTLYRHLIQEFNLPPQRLDHSGSCGLASIFIALGKNGNDRDAFNIWLRPQRSEIGRRMRENIEQYRHILPLHRGQTVENYITGIENSNYLTDVEIEIIAQIIQRPIGIFKIEYPKIFFDGNRKLIPHTTYGREIEADPIYLVLDGISYSPLIRKLPISNSGQ